MSQFALPSYVHAGDLHGALLFYSRVIANSDEEIICDATGLKFVDPIGLCLLAAASHKLAQGNTRLKLLNVQDGISGYLARMDLFKACGLEYDNNFKRHDQTHNLVEICVLDKRADVDPLAKRISDALVGRMPEYDPEAEPDEMTGRLPHESISSPLAYIFNELLENALTHGRRAGYRNAQAWVAAQYYPSKDLIRLAVLDNGCGFLESLRKHPDMGEESHLAATRLALLPRVTCNPDLEIAPHQTANQGIGLTVVRDIVSHSRGVMRLVSGDCLLKLSSAPRQYESRITPWQGVILSIEFKRDPLRGTNIRHIIQAIRGKSSPRGLRFE